MVSRTFFYALTFPHAGGKADRRLAESCFSTGADSPDGLAKKPPLPCKPPRNGALPTRLPPSFSGKRCHLCAAPLAIPPMPDGCISRHSCPARDGSSSATPLPPKALSSCFPPARGNGKGNHKPTCPARRHGK